MAAISGKKIFFHSLEMTREELDLRRLARFSMIPRQALISGEAMSKILLPSVDFSRQVKFGSEQLREANKNIVFSDRCGLTPKEIALDIRKAKDTYGIDYYILDHFHRVNLMTMKYEYRHAMSEGLEMIISACKNCKVTPIILAQLNRDIHKRETGQQEPKLFDLRECGRLEEAATCVLMVHWPYKSTYVEEEKEAFFILCAKNRDGETGRIQFKIKPETYTFI
jgi:replicative DNA helicase